MSNKKFYIVGTDSTPPWLLQELCKAEGMDGFKLIPTKMMESTVPPISNPAWATIYSGLKPMEHEIIDFTSINRNYEKNLIDYDAEKYPPFWDKLAQAGYKCLVMNPVMVLETSRLSNVDMVTGFPLPPDFSSKAIEEVCKQYDFTAEPDIGNAMNTGKLSVENGMAQYAEATKKRAAVSEHLIDSNNYDLVFVCFSETDRLLHYTLTLGNWKDLVTPVYKGISDFLVYLDKRIKEKNEEAVLLLLSDHGASPTQYKFLSNSWLVNNGYLKFKDEVYKRQITVHSDTVVSKIKGKIIDSIVENPMRRIVYSKLPKSLKKIGEGFIEASEEYEAAGNYIKIKESDFDMPNTKAFCTITSGGMGMIWINDSRFSSPGIKEGEKDGIIKEISERLSKEQFMDGVYKGSDYYSDSKTLIAPDVVFELKKGYTNDFGGYLKDKCIVPTSMSRRGEHTKEGIIGAKFYNTQPISEEIQISDIYHIVLKYFGVN